MLIEYCKSQIFSIKIGENISLVISMDSHKETEWIKPVAYKPDVLSLIQESTWWK